MSMEEKTQALLAVAKAYYDRNAYVQYDQRSMDRVLELTPRRRKRLPPEAANSQYTQFLDCSGFVNAVYLNTFGYELPSDLTWHMVDLLEPRIYYYELTHQETPEQQAKIESEVRAILQPGDVITYERNVGSGHTVLYIGDGKYTDSTVPKGQPNSYDYVNFKNNYHERGIWIKNLDMLFDKDDENQLKRWSLFCKDTRRFSVSRPLKCMGDPLPSALVRIHEAKGLWCSVENSAPGCKMIQPGDPILYTVLVRNQNPERKQIQIQFSAPDGCELQSEHFSIHTLASGEEVRVTFRISTPESFSGNYIDGPSISVNGLPVFAHRVLVGRLLTEAEQALINHEVAASVKNGCTALEAAADAYSKLGVHVESRECEYAHSHFFLHDSTRGDVLSRRPQEPRKDLGVYSAFGGRGVIAPEMGSLVVGPRVTQFERSDLRPGDILICLDDAVGKNAYSSYYDGEYFIGCFEANGDSGSIHGAELDTFIDSLFGRFAFLLLRPSLGIGTRMK